MPGIEFLVMHRPKFTQSGYAPQCLGPCQPTQGGIMDGLSGMNSSSGCVTGCV